MIISASRRTDIPNYYSEWFINRIKEGFVYVRNPINLHQVSKVSLTPDVVDCIVFWTKNPKNMLKYINELNNYSFYFQFTVTGYGKDVEPNIPDKQTEIIETFKMLSEKIGKEKVIWRYDPILVNSKYTCEYHLRAFRKIAEQLKNHTKKVIISFVDLYEKTKRSTKDLNIENLNLSQMIELASKLSLIASENGLEIETCAEQIDLSEIGISHGCCIDKKLIEQIIGSKIKLEKDKNQRLECGCFESIDIGRYNSCPNGCKYCYANFNSQSVENCVDLYDITSPILCDAIKDDDKITIRKMKSQKEQQLTLLDSISN